MKKKGYLLTEPEFIDGSMITVISLEAATMIKFQQLRDLLVDFLTTSPNIEKYLEHVLTIKKDDNHQELYLSN